MYLFVYKHKKSYVNTLAIDIELVEHCYTDSTLGDEKQNMGRL